jgi:hypothetical protein
MTRLCQSIVCLAAATTVWVAPAQNLPLAIENAPAVSPSLMPSSPPEPSPVALFRNLLAMSPKERLDFLTNRPPPLRVRILAKVHEYEIMDPDERELRLRATELRWYLMPLLQMAPTNATNRDEQLAHVPEDLRDLVKTRLNEWEILPPQLKQEFLENDRALHYFTRIVPPGYSVVESVSDQQQQNISDAFNQFFELKPAEKQATLNTLSVAERASMEKTLQSFDQMPPQQRSQCVLNYAKFAGMSPAERAEFLKNAERWSQMSPEERQTWRDLVAHVPPWPPLPPSTFPPGLVPPAPPMPTTPPGNPRPNVATN